MPKATLMYNLDDEDDKHAFDVAAKASDYQMFVYRFSEDVLRPLWKHGDVQRFETTEKLLDHIQREFRRIYEWYGLQDPL